VTSWLVAALALLLGAAPLLVVLLRADTVGRLVALEVAGVNLALALLLLGRHFDRSFYADEGVALALLSLAGGLLFVRALERWL
jgi:multisubunit Na+/H+ antiporter MnhF subunit